MTGPLELALSEIQRARHDLVEAESVFETLLKELGPLLPRAQKTAVTDAVSLALTRMRAARDKLDGLVPPD